MNILMLVVGVAFFILSFGILFKKMKIWPKSNREQVYPMQLGGAYGLSVILGVAFIVLAVNY